MHMHMHAPVGGDSSRPVRILSRQPSGQRVAPISIGRCRPRAVCCSFTHGVPDGPDRWKSTTNSARGSDTNWAAAHALHEVCGIVMSIEAEEEGKTTGAHKHGLVLLGPTSTAPTGALPYGDSF